MLKLKKGMVMFIALIAVLSLALVGCGGNDEGNGTPGTGGDNNNEGLSGEVIIAGSTSVAPLSEAWKHAFEEQNPDVKITVQSTGSSAGVKAAQEKAADFGASSRALKEEEEATPITGHIVARDGIAPVVHPDNQVTNLSLDQVAKIFKGEITNWKDVGGADAPIVVVSREEGSGTRGAFEEILGFEGALVANALIGNGTGQVRQTVAGETNAIGYVSLGGLNQQVKAVSVDNVEPTLENVIAEKYPIARPFVYITSNEAEQSPQAKAFFDFVMSEEGQKIVEEEGFIPVK